MRDLRRWLIEKLGGVPQGRYDAARKELEKTKADLDAVGRRYQEVLLDRAELCRDQTASQERLKGYDELWYRRE